MTRSYSANLANNCRIYIGQYTGDGTVAMAIIGIPFQPRFLWITPHALAQDLSGATYACVRHENMTTNLAVVSYMRLIYDNRVISLDANGFTVDDDNANAHPNTLNQVYDYVAWG